MLTKSEILSQIAEDYPDRELVAAYLESKAQRSSKSYDTAKRAITGFLYDNKPIVEMTYNDLMQISRSINTTSLAKISKGAYWSTIRAYYQWALDRIREGGVNASNQLPLRVVFDETQRDADLEVQREEAIEVFDDDQLAHLDLKAKMLGFKYSVIESLLKHCGARCGEILTLHPGNVNLLERYWISGLVRDARKRGKVIYFFPAMLVPKLKQYLMTVETDWMFPGNSGEHLQVKSVIHTLGVMTHSFRKTLNTRRAKKGCPEEIRSLLLNQKPIGVNAASYTKLSLKEKRDLYDKWHPF